MDTYSLNGHLDSAAAPPMAVDLLEMRGTPVCVDGSAVRFAGTLPLQVLVAAHNQWRDDGHAFKIAPFSPQFASAAAGLGIELSALGASAMDVIVAEEQE